MSVLEAVFWFSALVIFYAYAGYGVIIAALATWRPRPHRQESITPEVSLIIAAYNEEAVIREKILNSLGQTYPREHLEIMVASDGSTDDTATITREYQDAGVVSLHRPGRMGKAAAVARAVASARGDILVFSDANSMYTRDTIAKLVRNFADPAVGCVAGEKRIQAAEGGAAQEAGLYWRYESFLKRMDSRVNDVVGAAGEIFAVRRSLFQPAEPDSIIEDFVMSMRIAAAGHRVVYEPEAISLEEAPATIADEFERRSRISAGGFQSIVRLRGLQASRQRLLFFQYLSHRVLRWAVVPFLLPTLLVANLLLASHPVYQILLAVQVGLIGLAGSVWVLECRGRRAPRVARVPFYFYMVNIAALAGFYRYVAGRQQVTWKRTGRMDARSRAAPSAALSPSAQSGVADKR